MSTLSGTGGRERPAGSALALVLDVGNGALVSPIERGRQGAGSLGLEGGGQTTKVGSAVEVETLEYLAEFLSGQVTKLVHAQGEGLVGLLVVLGDVLHVLLPGVPAVDELLVGVGLLVSLHPPGEVGSQGILGGKGHAEGREDEHSDGKLHIGVFEVVVC